LNVNCIALAGGKSTRLGRNKLVETVGEKMLLHRVLDVLSVLGREVIIVASKNIPLPDISSYPQARIVDDIYPGRGLLGGIYTGLVASESDCSFVVASDMPFLNVNLLQHMLSLADGADLVAFREGDRFEPLHAVYSRRCLDALAGLMQHENARILEIVDSVKTRYLPPEDLAAMDPMRLSFFNINTENDLTRAREIAKGISGPAISSSSPFICE
jgi:molybdopterin-guanine dinucleotide biosynthesis protein A